MVCSESSLIEKRKFKLTTTEKRLGFLLKSKPLFGFKTHRLSTICVTAITAYFNNVVMSRMLAMFAAKIRILSFRTAAGFIAAFIILRHKFKPPYPKT
jgi:hypothetical protein